MIEIYSWEILNEISKKRANSKDNFIKCLNVYRNVFSNNFIVRNFLNGLPKEEYLNLKSFTYLLHNIIKGFGLH